MVVLILLLLVSFGAIFYGLFLLAFKSGRRKKGGKIALWSFLASFVLLIAVGAASDNEEAQKAGFASATDRNNAQERGAQTAEEWAKIKAQDAAEAQVEKTEREAEAEKARVEAERKRQAEEAARRAIEQAEREREAEAKREEKRKGFHCLSAWDGSHSEFKRQVKQMMREPKSFEHIETRVTPVSDNGTHTAIMTYRARNGFGGMNVGTAIGEYRNSTCAVVVLSVE